MFPLLSSFVSVKSGAESPTSTLPARMRPHGLKRADEEHFPGQMHHHAGKCLRRTMHDPPHVADKNSPENEYHDERSRRDLDPATAWFSGNGRYNGLFHSQ